MRARKKKNIDARLEKGSDLIADHIILNDKPLHIEIGCGKGQFITKIAQDFDYNFYALEKEKHVAVMAIEKAVNNNLTNIKFILNDAVSLENCCPEHSVDIIYLNFSDPWPKNRDTEKRLTHHNFLNIYKKILKNDGFIIIKTDNVKLFDFTIEEINLSGFEILSISRDLHHSDIENPYKTEYEQRFSEQGVNINYLKIYVKNNFTETLNAKD